MQVETPTMTLNTSKHGSCITMADHRVPRRSLCLHVRRFPSGTDRHWEFRSIPVEERPVPKTRKSEHPNVCSKFFC